MYMFRILIVTKPLSLVDVRGDAVVTSANEKTK